MNSRPTIGGRPATRPIIRSYGNDELSVQVPIRQPRADENYGPFECTRCDNIWWARVPEPKQCPECKSPYWHVERSRFF